MLFHWGLAAAQRALPRPLTRGGRTPAALASCSRHLARAQLAHTAPASMLSRDAATVQEHFRHTGAMSRQVVSADPQRGNPIHVRTCHRSVQQLCGRAGSLATVLLKTHTGVHASLDLNLAVAAAPAAPVSPIPWVRASDSCQRPYPHPCPRPCRRPWRSTSDPTWCHSSVVARVAVWWGEGARWRASGSWPALALQRGQERSCGRRRARLLAVLPGRGRGGGAVGRSDARGEQ